MYFRSQNISALCGIVLSIIITGSDSSREFGDAPLTFDQLAKPTFGLKEHARFQGNGMYRLGYEDVAEVTGDGYVLVSDERAPGVHIFDPKDKYIGKIGTSGRGPGEFQQIRGISLFENDSLLVSDARLFRASIFAREGSKWKYARSFTYKPTTEDGYNVWSLRKEPGIRGYLATLIVTNTSAANQRPHQDPVLRLISESGTELKKTFLAYKDMEVVIERTEKSVSVADKPFPRKSVIRFADSGTHYVAPWTDKLSIEKRNASGQVLSTFNIDITPRKVLPGHRAFSEAAQYDGMEKHMPETHPALTDFLVSDKGNFWINLGPLDAKHQVLAVFSPDGKHLGSTLLSSTMDLQGIRNGKLYVLADRYSDPAIVVYDAEW